MSAPVVPSPPQSAAAFLAAVRAHEQEGELYQAYDLAMQGLEHHPGDVALQHRAVLNLASAGGRLEAQNKYDAFKLAEHAGLDAQTLGARLKKDLAFELDEKTRGGALLHAATLYLAAFRWAQVREPEGAAYPGINAATLMLLAGDRRAKALAQEVLAALPNPPGPAEPYYTIATRIEAHLVLNEVRKAQALVPAAVDAQAAARDVRARGTTVQQCRRILAFRGADAAWLEPLAPPRVLHYTGHLIGAPGQVKRFMAHEESTVRDRIAKQLAREPIAAAFGSLSAGADILFAEALLDLGVRLHVVLPFRETDFIEVSVRPSGDGWVERYRACCKRATSYREATEDAYLGDDRLFRYCSQIAMGLALSHARQIVAPVEQIAVSDGTFDSGVPGEPSDVQLWKRAARRKQTIIRCGDGAAGAPPPAAGRTRSKPPAPKRAPSRRREVRAMWFADVKGFSKLTDDQLPPFVDEVLGLFARVLKRYGEAYEFVNTWGDGVFVVSDDAGRVAQLALAVQEEMTTLDRKKLGFDPEMAVRIGGHLGPVFPTHDPVRQTPNYFGAHVSRAARVEPQTPPGEVYVTEPFAAVLALHNAEQFVCDYIGHLEAAKKYGKLRMFRLRRNPDAKRRGA